MNPKVTQITEKNQSTFEIEDPKIGKLEVVVRALPALTLLKHIDVFNKLKGTKEFNTDDMTEAQAASIKDEILPVMEIVLPACVLDPPIATEDNDPRLKSQDAVHLKDLSFRIVIDIFNHIMKISGLDSEAEELRKKLPSQTSV